MVKQRDQTNRERSRGRVRIIFEGLGADEMENRPVRVVVGTVGQVLEQMKSSAFLAGGEGIISGPHKSHMARDSSLNTGSLRRNAPWRDMEL